MTKPLNYKLDVNNIQSLKDVKNVFKVMNLVSNATEEHENYEIIKEYFTIPYVPEPVKLKWENMKND